MKQLPTRKKGNNTKISKKLADKLSETFLRMTLLSIVYFSKGGHPSKGLLIGKEYFKGEIIYTVILANENCVEHTINVPLNENNAGLLDIGKSLSIKDMSINIKNIKELRFEAKYMEEEFPITEDSLEGFIWGYKILNIKDNPYLTMLCYDSIMDEYSYEPYDLWVTPPASTQIKPKAGVNIAIDPNFDHIIDIYLGKYGSYKDSIYKVIEVYTNTPNEIELTLAKKNEQLEKIEHKVKFDDFVLTNGEPVDPILERIYTISDRNRENSKAKFPLWTIIEHKNTKHLKNVVQVMGYGLQKYWNTLGVIICNIETLKYELVSQFTLTNADLTKKSSITPYDYNYSHTPPKPPIPTAPTIIARFKYKAEIPLIIEFDD